MIFTKFIRRNLDNSLYEDLISGFFKEVIDEIKILKNEIYTNNPNPFVNYIYEEYELDPIIKGEIKEKYQKKYCPTFLFNYFNQSEKMNYLMLRVEIDRLLGINKTKYEI